MLYRPEQFELAPGHPLLAGLQFAALGRAPGSLRCWDDSRRGNHALLIGMIPETRWVWVPRLGRWGLALDGTDDRARVASAVPCLGEMTISAWVNVAGLPAWEGVILSNRDGSNEDYYLGISSTGRKTVGWANNYIIHNSGQVLSTGTWYHVVGVRSGVSGAWTAQAYVDGALDATNGPYGWTDPNSSAASQMTVGRHGTYGGYYLNGTLADVMLWNRALSVAEIYALAARSNVMLGGLILPPRRRVFPAAAAAATGNAARRRRADYYYRQLRAA